VQGFSLDAQVERIKAYALSQDYTVLAMLRDDGFSAKDLNRPGIRRLLADVRAGGVDVVLVYKLDRLSRRLRDLTEILDLVAEHGARFESVTEPFETKSAPGRLMLNVLGGFAQFEREVNGERVLLAMERRFRQGKWMVQPPYGYRMMDGLLVVEPTEATLVRRIFQRYLGDGFGAKELARELNSEGRRTRRGCPWRAGGVHRVLTNRAYLGRVVWRGQERAGTHEPLVGEDLFKAVQHKLRARRQAPPRRLTSENLLVGLTRCGRCGASMFVQRPGNTGKRHYRYYVCAHRAEDRSCVQPYIPAARLEGAVVGKIQELSTDPNSSSRSSPGR
jgi:site-specific DNA recombinase